MTDEVRTPLRKKVDKDRTIMIPNKSTKEISLYMPMWCKVKRSFQDNKGKVYITIIRD